jgi:predicted transcriptional regulator
MQKFILFSIALFFMTQVGSAMINTSHKMPAFLLTDGNDSILDSSSLKGKAIIGFYNSRETSEKNIHLEKELNQFYLQRKKTDSDLHRLAVADGSPAISATRWIWKKTIIKLSEKRGVHFYGDWDGAMRNSFGFPENESVFIIIDKTGIVRYIHAGLVPLTEYERIKEIILQILK